MKRVLYSAVFFLWSMSGLPAYAQMQEAVTETVRTGIAVQADSKPHWEVSVRAGLVGGGPTIHAGIAAAYAFSEFGLRAEFSPGVSRGYQVLDVSLDGGRLFRDGFIWSLGVAQETSIDAGMWEPRLGPTFTLGWRRGKWSVEARGNLYFLHIGPALGAWMGYRFY